MRRPRYHNSPRYLNSPKPYVEKPPSKPVLGPFTKTDLIVLLLSPLWIPLIIPFLPAIIKRLRSYQRGPFRSKSAG